MDFTSFATHAHKIENADGDNEKTTLTSGLLIAAADSEEFDSRVMDTVDALGVCANFIQGSVFPGWSEAKLSIGPALCFKAVAKAAGDNYTKDDIEDLVAKHGDIGTVAENLEFGEQQGLAAFGNSGYNGGSDLTMKDVYTSLETLAFTSGSGSQSEKVGILFRLLNKCSPQEARYITRIVLDEMRIGVGPGTVRDAISNSFNTPKQELKRAIQASNDYSEVSRAARDGGVEALSKIQVEIGRPVQAMKAKKGTISDALQKSETVAVEYKFDGSRAQIHYDGNDTIQIFSRNMENVTESIPEVVEYVKEHVSEEVILDGEVIAIDKNGTPLPFQEVQTRFGRKENIEEKRKETPVEYHAFDCLYREGDDLLTDPVHERYDALKSVYPEEYVARQIVSNDAEEIAEMNMEALSENQEGVMLKNPDSPYSPGKRGKDWIKQKPEVETLDLAVTGAEWGEGRRAQLMGSFLLSARNTENGSFEFVSKVGTGPTDNDLEELTERLEPYIQNENGKEITLKPELVVEIGCEEIQSSENESGFALRFPRFIAIREDKDVDDSETISRISDLYEKQ